MTVSLGEYQYWRQQALGPDAYNCTLYNVVKGHVVRHCELHREMQRSLVLLRAAYYSSKGVTRND